jgi:hypothetical protein
LLVQLEWFANLAVFSGGIDATPLTRSFHGSRLEQAHPAMRAAVFLL